MFVYHPINPVIFHILGPLSVHWYGLMYVLGFVLIWCLAHLRVKKSNGVWTDGQFSDLLFYAVIGVVVGGRLGYMLFYDLPNFIHNPLIIFKVWEGGMSFHGGCVGVILMMLLFARKRKKNFIAVMDFVAPLVPIGLAAGRIGNFINGELWGRVTNVPWAIIYANVDNRPRHPSEIYEFLLEGVLLFIILWVYSSKPRPRLAVSALFLIGYGVARCFCEFFRLPDPQYGYLAFGWLTMGQLLSIPMIIIGGTLLWRAYRIKK